MPINTIQSQAIPIPRKDIDTDQIIPGDFLRVTVKDGLGKHLFCRVKDEPDFRFFSARTGGRILVTRDNFGCGSSREHAPWALSDYGIQVIIAPSFADIFKNNAMKNGILPVTLSAETVELILSQASASEDYTLTVDLPAQTVKLPDGAKFGFEIDPYRKQCLVKGMDDMDYLLSQKDAIREFDKARGEFLFFNFHF